LKIFSGVGGQKTLNFEITAGFKMDLKIPSDFFLFFAVLKKMVLNDTQIPV
jgi:hypothetical protein